MASGSGERSRSWVMAGEPRHSVDSRLITVERDCDDLLSGVTDGVPPEGAEGQRRVNGGSHRYLRAQGVAWGQQRVTSLQETL